VRRLLDAGAEVFATRGYHATRVDHVVRRARTSHGTFYLYFASKEDLFRALALDVVDELRVLTDEIGVIEPTARGLRELREWVRRFVALGERHGPIIRAWTEAEVGTSEVGRLGTELLGEVALTLVAMAVVAMVERFNYYLLSGQIETPAEQVVDFLAGVAYAGLFGGPVPRLRAPAGLS